MSNAQALTTVLAHVAEHQDEWRQQWWTDCFAGQTLRVLEGARLAESECCPESSALVAQGRYYCGYNIGVRAAQLLGLTSFQAERLFSADNSLEMVTELVEEFIKQDATPPEVALAA